MESSKADAKNQKTLEFFDKAIRLGKERMARAVAEVMADLEAQGVKRAPIKFGFLRASIKRMPVTVVQSNGRYLLESGVAARTPYAFTQHEGLNFNHPKGGEAEFLVRPMRERNAMYRKSLADAALAVIKEAAL